MSSNPLDASVICWHVQVNMNIEHTACKSDNIIVTSFFSRSIRKNKACNSDNTIATRFFVKRHQAAR
jgi:hypothetical protein